MNPRQSVAGDFSVRKVRSREWIEIVPWDGASDFGSEETEKSSFLLLIAMAFSY